MSKKNNCCWVLKTATEPGGPVYCDEPTRYKMALDDDRNKVRVYDHLCPTHRRQEIMTAKIDDFQEVSDEY